MRTWLLPCAPICSGILKNKKLTHTLVSIIDAHGLEDGCSKETGALVILLATTLPASAIEHRPLLMEYILGGKIATNDQVTAAVKYVTAQAGSKMDKGALEKAAGVGVDVTDEDVASAVSQVLEANKAVLLEERYHFNFNKLIQPVKKIGVMVWADISKVKAELERQSAEVLGPKTADDEQPKEKPKKMKAPKVCQV
jgi:glutaminyl-tRNA synthetase